MDRGNRKSIEVEEGKKVESGATVEWTEARNEEAGWAARTPDIEKRRKKC